MRQYLTQRLFYTLLLLVLISLFSFFVIQLPPGDFLSHYAAQLADLGDEVSERELEGLRRQYGLDQPIYVQYLKWIWGLLRGSMGYSLEHQRPVAELIVERLGLTAVVSLLTVVVAYMIAIPIGVYSATHQYSAGDYTFTVVGFIGLATPNFLLALILMFILARYFGFAVGGLFSPDFAVAPWSLAKVFDMLKHLPLPMIVVGTSSASGLIRVMRGGLLDELNRQYVVTVRAKGLGERRLLFKYPVRVSLNPIVSTVGWVLPDIVSGTIVTAIVLSLPTTGPLLFRALISQDMYLAGSIVMLLSFLTVIGTFISDLLLVFLDPRIRFQKKEGD